MTYTTIDFDDGEPYVLRRPRGIVVLHGPGGPHGNLIRFDALVDTGADFLHLPEDAAHGVGISLTNASLVELLTAGGKIHMKQQKVDVEIQGLLVKIPVNFGENALPLIGRQAIFEVLDTVGFSPTEWLIDWHKPKPQPEPSPLPQPAPEPPLQIKECDNCVFIGGVKLKKRAPDEE